MKRFVPLSILLIFLNLPFTCILAQKKDGNRAFKKKREKVELSNYYIALNTNEALNYYTGLLEWKIDSLKDVETDALTRNNLNLLKYTTSNAIAKSTFHTDPLVGALDTWALTLQLKNYFASEKVKAKYDENIAVL